MRDFSQCSIFASDHSGTTKTSGFEVCGRKDFFRLHQRLPLTVSEGLTSSAPMSPDEAPLYHFTLKAERHAGSHSLIRAGSVLVASASCWQLFALPSSAASFANKPMSMPIRIVAVLVGSAQPIHKIVSIGVSRVLIRDLAFAIIS